MRIPCSKQCKVLICECTFILPEHRTRAKRTRHLHLEMLPSMLADVESEHIVLIHFSRRYTPELIRKKVFNLLTFRGTFSRPTVSLISSPNYLETACSGVPARSM